MRILLDQNLSPKLIRKLTDLFPGLESVYNHHLTGAADPPIFQWAQEQQIKAIVTNNSD